MKYDGTTAPLLTPPNSGHRQPLPWRDHGTALAFHMGKYNKAVEQQGFVVDHPVGDGMALPPWGPFALPMLHGICQMLALRRGRQPAGYI